MSPVGLNDAGGEAGWGPGPGCVEDRYVRDSHHVGGRVSGASGIAGARVRREDGTSAAVRVVDMTAAWAGTRVCDVPAGRRGEGRASRARVGVPFRRPAGWRSGRRAYRSRRPRDAGRRNAEVVVRGPVEEGCADGCGMPPFVRRVSPSARVGGGGEGYTRASGAGRGERGPVRAAAVRRVRCRTDPEHRPGSGPGAGAGAGHELGLGSGQLAALPVKSVDVRSYQLIKNITVVIR
ncbi:hypothetical protein SAMN05216533_3572 [Streptomyces sp. Ag109_O5-10]|nr:hypothetical protein SAMN05216533_3572 [Streptomyces sp. Ag109_O5-10]